MPIPWKILDYFLYDSSDWLKHSQLIKSFLKRTIINKLHSIIIILPIKYILRLDNHYYYLFLVNYKSKSTWPIALRR